MVSQRERVVATRFCHNGLVGARSSLALRELFSPQNLPWPHFSINLSQPTWAGEGGRPPCAAKHDSFLPRRLPKKKKEGSDTEIVSLTHDLFAPLLFCDATAGLDGLDARKSPPHNLYAQAVSSFSFFPPASPRFSADGFLRSTYLSGHDQWSDLVCFPRGESHGHGSMTTGRRHPMDLDSVPAS